MRVVEPECALHAAHFVVVRLGAEDEAGDAELVVVTAGAARHRAAEHRPLGTGVNRQLEMFLAEGALLQLTRQQIRLDDRVQLLPLAVEPFKNPSPLNVSGKGKL